MNPVSLAMDGLLAVLLLAAAGVGLRVNGKLKLLRDGQGQFVRAVADLDTAAGRAEAGLAALRGATEEAHDALLTRIETARGLMPKMDRACEDAATASARLEEAVRAADAAGRRAHDAAQSAARTLAQAAAPPIAPPIQPQAEPPGSQVLSGEAMAERAVEMLERLTGRDLPAAPPRPSAEPIPFPALPDRPRRSAKAAPEPADRAPRREPVPARPRGAASASPPSPEPATAGGDRLARFVARRQGARS